MPEDQIESAEERAKARLQQDRDDLNNEVAGRDTGRIKRFVAPDHIGSGTTSSGKNSDEFAYTIINHILTKQQQEQYERLQQEFALYDEATKLALEEIDRDIEKAEQELQRVRDNATVLADGRRVYSDEITGQFYDEQDIVLSETDELEARAAFNDNDSSRQDFKNSVHKIKELKHEREQVVEFKNKKDELEERLEDNPEENEAIKQELHDLPMPDRVRHSYSENNPQNSTELRSAEPTSVSKANFGNDIDSEFTLTPAFCHAGCLEHSDQQPAPDHDSRDIKPQATPGLTPV